MLIIDVGETWVGVEVWIDPTVASGVCVTVGKATTSEGVTVFEDEHAVNNTPVAIRLNINDFNIRSPIRFGKYVNFVIASSDYGQPVP